MFKELCNFIDVFDRFLNTAYLIFFSIVPEDALQDVLYFKMQDIY